MPKTLSYKSSNDDGDDDDDDEVDLEKIYNTSYLFAYRTRVAEVTIFDTRKANENGESAFIYPFVEYLKDQDGKMFLQSIGVDKGVGYVAVRASPDENKSQKNAKGWANKVRLVAIIQILIIILLTNLSVLCT